MFAEHDKKTIDQYIFELSKIFKKIKEFEDGKEINDYLEGPVCHSGFSDSIKIHIKQMKIKNIF